MTGSGRDPAGWLLALAVWLLPAERGEWGRAMSAELSGIDRPLSRWRFAGGCLRAAVWQGRRWRVVGVVSGQAAAVVGAVVSPIGGGLRAEVIALAVLMPPALWLIGRTPGRFGRLGPGRAARIGRRGGLALVSGCVVVAAGFIADHSNYQGGISQAAVCLGVVVVILSGYTATVLAVTSAKSTVSPAALGLGSRFGLVAGVAGFALLPLNQSLAVHGPWLALYAGAVALVVAGCPATAATLTARRRRDVGQGVRAGACTGMVAALVLFIVGIASVWADPGLADSSIDKGPAWLPPDVISAAGSYVVVLVVVPLIGLLCGLLGAVSGGLGRPTSVSPAAAMPGSQGISVRSWAVLLTGVALTGIACYPLVTHVSRASFGGVGATSVAFSANGRAMLTGADGGMASILWNLTDPDRPRRSATVTGTAVFAPDGRTIATRGLLWNVTNPAHPTRVGSFGGGDPVAFSPNGQTLATEDKGVVVLWNVSEPTHPTRLAALAPGGWGTFSPDGRTFATSSTNPPATTTLWDVAADTRPVRLVTVAGGNGAVFSPGSRMLATRADNGRVILWSLADPHHPVRIATLTGGNDPQPMAAVVFSPNGRQLVTASNDGSVKLWNVTDPARVATLARADDNANGQIGVSSTLTVAAFSPDGRTLATITGNDAVTIWDVADPARPVRTTVLTRRTRGAGQVAFSPDLTSIGGTASDGADTAGLWRIQ